MSAAHRLRKQLDTPASLVGGVTTILNIADVRAVVDETERLRSVLTEIATGRDSGGHLSDFPRDTAAAALGIVAGVWPATKVRK